MLFVTVLQQLCKSPFRKSIAAQATEALFFCNSFANSRVQALNRFQLLHHTLMPCAGVDPFDHASVFVTQEISNLSRCLTTFLCSCCEGGSEIVWRISFDAQMIKRLSLYSLGARITPRVFTTKNITTFLLNSFQDCLRFGSNQESSGRENSFRSIDECFAFIGIDNDSFHLTVILFQMQIFPLKSINFFRT